MHVASTFAARIAGLGYDFQPIVSVRTGEAFGFEALLRGTTALGHASIAAFFAEMSGAGDAVALEFELLEMAVRRFLRFADRTPLRLFFNTNSRVFEDPAFSYNAIRSLVERCGLPVSRLCLEICETVRLDFSLAANVLQHRKNRIGFAIDDFGTGHSGLKMLLESRPDFVKIDRFFIAGADGDREKRNVLTHVVALAHSLGIIVIAEGVETEPEFVLCRELGCDYVQGYLIQRPTSDEARLLEAYESVARINARERRAPANSPDTLRRILDPVSPVSIDASMTDVLRAFGDRHDRSFFPVVGVQGEALGIVHERTLKRLVYSPFGRQLLTSVAAPQHLQEYVTPTLTFDISSNINLLLDAIALRPEDSAVLITEFDRYVGLLDTAAIIRTMHDRLLEHARDANPLTKLPGNVKIAEFVDGAMESRAYPVSCFYFDFDFFKPFNDRFGFRQGDRAIVMFAQSLRTEFTERGVFIGHIGGDDFFVGAVGAATERTRAAVPHVIDRFALSMQAFYDDEARACGYISALDREGAMRRIPLLTVSCAAIVIEGAGEGISLDTIASELASLKSEAKRSPSKFAIKTIDVSAAR